MLTVACIRWKGKCQKHPRFDPATDGPGTIKGGCSNAHNWSRSFKTTKRPFGSCAPLARSKARSTSQQNISIRARCSRRRAFKRKIPEVRTDMHSNRNRGPKMANSRISQDVREHVPLEAHVISDRLLSAGVGTSWHSARSSLRMDSALHSKTRYFTPFFS